MSKPDAATKPAYVLETCGHIGHLLDYNEFKDLVGVFYIAIRNQEFTEYRLYAIPDSETGLGVMEQLQPLLDANEWKAIQLRMLSDEDFIVRQKAELHEFTGIVARMMLQQLLTIAFLQMMVENLSSNGIEVDEPTPTSS